MSITPTRPRPPQPWPWNPELMHEAFTCGDCWLLARTLYERYEGLSLCVLATPDEDCPEIFPEEYGWCHVMVRDPRSGHYLDIEGEHTFEDLTYAWDWAGWEELIEDVPPENFDHISRVFPGVSVDVAIQRMIAATGWDPPPLRTRSNQN